MQSNFLYNTLNNTIYSHRNRYSPLSNYTNAFPSTRKLNSSLNKSKFHNYSFNYDLNDDFFQIDFTNKSRTKGRIIDNEFI